jgi:hypothetical protein
MDYSAIKTLIQTHPQWPSVADADLVTWVNAKTVNKVKERLPSGDVFAVIAGNIADFSTLTADQKQLVRDILYIHTSEGIPTAVGTAARTLLQNIFAGTATLTALGQAATYSISRAENVGVREPVDIWIIAEARRLAGV